MPQPIFFSLRDLETLVRRSLPAATPQVYCRFCNTLQYNTYYLLTRPERNKKHPSLETPESNRRNLCKMFQVDGGPARTKLPPIGGGSSELWNIARIAVQSVKFLQESGRIRLFRMPGTHLTCRPLWVAVAAVKEQL
jgi:hypothetical protein